MTTEATENPQPQQRPVVDAVEVYRILGGLKKGQANLEKGQANLEKGQAELKEQILRQEERNEQRAARQEERNEQRAAREEERNEQRFRDMIRRIDRLTYTIIGGLFALGVALILQNVFGG